MSGYYTVQNVELIEDFDPDQYGNHWYNVKFAEEEDTYLWLAKNKPIDSQRVYGHVEPTKSGKRFRFKKDPIPEDDSGSQGEATTTSATLGPNTEARPPAAADSKYLKDVSDMKYRVWVKLLDKLDTSEAREIHKQKYAGEAADFWEAVDYHTDELLRGIENTRSGGLKRPRKPLRSPQAEIKPKPPPTG